MNQLTEALATLSQLLDDHKIGEARLLVQALQDFSSPPFGLYLLDARERRLIAATRALVTATLRQVEG